MKSIENKIKRICSFYINDWHLTTMLLPHINMQVKENKQEMTILEIGIKDNIKEILSKMNLNEELEKQILEIDWTSNTICKYTKIREEIISKARKSNKIEIIISGDNEYIKIANENIEKAIKNINNVEISIVNCYKIETNKETKPILDKHDYILNTSGIRKINENLKYNTIKNKKIIN